LGKLVSFEKRRRNAPSKMPPGTAGEVVIFTGVRYERDPQGKPADGSAPLKPKRKRG
jgi:hypothetical protein